VLLLPLLMVNSQSLLAVHIPANGFSNQWRVFFLAPGLQLAVALGRIDLHVLVASQSMDGSSGHERDCATHHHNDRIGRWIGEPPIFEGVRVLFKRLFGLDLGEDRRASRSENKIELCEMWPMCQILARIGKHIHPDELGAIVQIFTMSSMRTYRKCRSRSKSSLDDGEIFANRSSSGLSKGVHGCSVWLMN